MSEFEIVYSKSLGFQIRELGPPPSLRPGEILVRVQWVGICGSDLYLIETRDGELRLGHEWVGVVNKLGADVSGFFPGDVVTSTGTLACFECERCASGKTNFCDHATYLSSDRMGALRSWMIVTQKNLVKINGAPAKEQVLHELIAVAEEAVQLIDIHATAAPVTNSNLLILGGGPVGLLLALVAKDHGYKPTIVEKREYRVELAKKKGISAALLSRAIVDSELAHHFDLIVDTTNDYRGDPGGFKYLTLFAKKNFTAVIVGKYIHSQGVPQSFNSLGGKLVWMRGITQETIQASVEKWNSRLKLLAEDFVTDVFPYERANEAFALASEKTRSMKVLIELKDRQFH